MLPASKYGESKTARIRASNYQQKNGKPPVHSIQLMPVRSATRPFSRGNSNQRRLTNRLADSCRGRLLFAYLCCLPIRLFR